MTLQTEINPGLRVSDRFVPTGSLVMPTESPKRTANIKDNPSDLRERVRAMNTPPTIVDNLFTIKKYPTDGSRVHFVAPIADGGKISLMQPTSPYGERDVLINAIPAGFEHQTEAPMYPDGEIRPHTWLDLPKQTRRAFSDASISILVEMETSSNSESHKAVFMQNFAATLAPETPQSQLHVHGHTVLMNKKDILTQEPKNEAKSTLIGIEQFPESITRGIERGRAILRDQPFMRLARNKLKDNLEEYTQEDSDEIGTYSMDVRQVPPFGVAICFDDENPITKDNATQPDNLKRIYHLRDAIAQVYPGIAETYEAAANKNDARGKKHGVIYPTEDLPLVRQPAHQEIIDFTQDGFLRIIVVPILDRVGPVEQLGVLLERSADVPPKTDHLRSNDYIRFTNVGMDQISKSVPVGDVKMNPVR